MGSRNEILAAALDVPIVGGAPVFPAVEKTERALVRVEAVANVFDNLIRAMQMDGAVPADIVESAERQKSLLLKLAIDEKQLAWILAEDTDLPLKQSMAAAKAITDR